MEEEARVLSIGFVVLGPSTANRPWEEALLSLSLRVGAARAGVSSPLNVNVVFMVPGSLRAPEFQGLRTGTFSKKNMLLMVQVALPADVPEDPGALLLTDLQGAIDEAEHWARKRRYDFDLTPLREIVARL